MNIGELRNVDGRLTGSIATRTIDLPQIWLRPVESHNDKAPAYEVVALNVGRRLVQIGALWEAAANTTGELFLQGTLDDPSLPEPLPIALFGNAEEGYRVAWRRPQRREAFGSVLRREPRGAPSGSDVAGGFGESTAGADGALMSAAAELGDDIPF